MSMFQRISGEIQTTLLTAKSRVNPIKPTTIPRLELLAALLLSRLINTVVTEISNVYEICQQFLWTESTIAYCWIQNGSREHKTFVQNRFA